MGTPDEDRAITLRTASELRDAAARHGIDLQEGAAEPLARYCLLLWDWNTRINLTRHLDLETFVTRDLADTLALSKLLEPGERVLDVGTGGGLPGIPLAVLRPDLQVALCESVRKKAEAVASIVSALHLPVVVYCRRAEDLLREESFDTLVVRAVAPLHKLLAWTRPHPESYKRMLAIKGRSWIEERAEARHRGLLREMELRRTAEYRRPGDDFASVILQIRPIR